MCTPCLVHPAGPMGRTHLKKGKREMQAAGRGGLEKSRGLESTVSKEEKLAAHRGRGWEREAARGVIRG